MVKVLYADDSRGNNAWYYARKSFAKAFVGCGHEVLLWDIHSKPAIDIFDQFQPDIYIGQTYTLDRGICKAIVERPSLRVILKGSDYSHYSDSIDISKYPILIANDKEIKNVEELNKLHPIDFIFSHYHPNRIQTTHNYWQDKLGIPVKAISLATDITEHTNGEFKEELKSDIAFVSGYWDYKAITLNKWFIPLCSDLNLNIKVFGNRNWPIPQYCGSIPDSLVRHLHKSAKVCVNIGEPHYKLDGNGDLNERTFKLLSNKCPIVQDYSQTIAEDFFPNGEVELAKTPEEFKEKIYAVISGDLKIDTQKGYDTVMNNHTYFSRVSGLFSYLGMENESIDALIKYEQIRKDNNL